MHALVTLNREFAALGFHRKPVGYHFAELLLHLATGVGAAIAFALLPGAIVRTIALVVMTFGNLGLTTYGHSAAHNGISPRGWINEALLLLTFGLAFGTSATWWRNKHNTVHHTTPNVIGLDDDVALLPWFALTDEEARSGGPRRRWYYRWQWAIVPIALALTAFSMMVSSWRFLGTILADPRRRNGRHAADAAAIGLHYVLWIGVPLFWFSGADVVGFYVLRGVLLGYIVFLNAAPAHFPAEARFLSTEGHADRYSYRRHSDYILLQTSTTVNFRAGWLGRLFCCGSQYQIEHHLFPAISHAYYPRMAPILRAFCEENGYPYQTLGWAEGIWKSLRVFWRPKPVEPALEAVRRRALREEVPPLSA
ncbi:MAG TPA: acyl-CoA desaturase [Vicinamibacterales bacterium]|nr:acyl-CoA desaturase [Vicinamibacterales bacterium]